LLGVPSIYVGYRDNDEQITQTELLDVTSHVTKELGQAVRIDRGYRILATIKEQIALQSAPEDAIWLAEIHRDSVKMTLRTEPRSDKPSAGIVPAAIVDFIR